MKHRIYRHYINVMISVLFCVCGCSAQKGIDAKYTNSNSIDLLFIVLENSYLSLHDVLLLAEEDDSNKKFKDSDFVIKHEFKDPNLFREYSQFVSRNSESVAHNITASGRLVLDRPPIYKLNLIDLLNSETKYKGYLYNNLHITGTKTWDIELSGNDVLVNMISDIETSDHESIYLELTGSIGLSTSLFSGEITAVLEVGGSRFPMSISNVHSNDCCTTEGDFLRQYALCTVESCQETSQPQKDLVAKIEDVLLKEEGISQHKDLIVSGGYWQKSIEPFENEIVGEISEVFGNFETSVTNFGFLDNFSEYDKEVSGGFIPVYPGRSRLYVKDNFLRFYAGRWGSGIQICINIEGFDFDVEFIKQNKIKIDLTSEQYKFSDYGICPPEVPNLITLQIVNPSQVIAGKIEIQPVSDPLSNDINNSCDLSENTTLSQFINVDVLYSAQLNTYDGVIAGVTTTTYLDVRNVILEMAK